MYTFFVSVITYLAALRYGLIVVPVNPLATPRELMLQLQETQCELLVYWTKQAHAVSEIVFHVPLKQCMAVELHSYAQGITRMILRFQEAPEEKCIFDEDHHVSWYDMVDKFRAQEDEPITQPYPELDADAVYQYTGGTTGFPKAAALTFRNITSNAYMCGDWLHRIPNGSVVLGMLPFFHIYGLATVLHVALVRRFHIVLYARFQSQDALKAIKKYRPAFFPGAPTMFASMLAHPKAERMLKNSGTVCISGSAPLHPETAKKWKTFTGAPLVEGYGLTEASPVTHANPVWGKTKAGSIGIPWPHTEVEIRSLETGAPLPAKEVGEMHVRGPQVMRAYHNRPIDTRNMLQNGWLKTGDIAYYDEEGYYFIVGRTKDVILSGGMNVYPNEVEEILAGHPTVKESVVIGEPDPYWGERVVAYVVSHLANPANEEDVLAWCKTQLTAYKCPKEIRFIDQLPRTPMGKILRHKLKTAREC
ncbi:MAG: AMP-binding protein [Bacilli bacterium]